MNVRQMLLRIQLKRAWFAQTFPSTLMYIKIHKFLKKFCLSAFAFMHLEDSNIQRQLQREVRKMRYHSTQLKLCPRSKGIKGQDYDCVVMVARLTFLPCPWGGGKTHSMQSLLHLAHASPLEFLSSRIAELLSSISEKG